jgi:hypothetical protein
VIVSVVEREITVAIVVEKKNGWEQSIGKLCSSLKKSSTKRNKISFYNNQLLHMHRTTIYCMSVYIINIIINTNV